MKPSSNPTKFLHTFYLATDMLLIVGLPVVVFTFGVMFIVLVFLLLIIWRPCGKYVSLKFGPKQIDVFSVQR